MGSVTSLEGYDAVIIGAPMYMGKMIDTVKFVTRLRDGLMKLPVAGFIVSLAPVSKDPVHMANSQKALHESLNPLLPVAETVFAGSLDMKKLSWFQRWMTKSVKSPVGDFRDWAAIAAWARELPESWRCEDRGSVTTWRAWLAIACLSLNTRPDSFTLKHKSGIFFRITITHHRDARVRSCALLFMIFSFNYHYRLYLHIFTPPPLLLYPIKIHITNIR